MASRAASNSMPGWYWPDDLRATTSSSDAQRSSESGTKSADRHNNPSSSSDTGPSPRSSPNNSQSRRRYWPPRQCRICLETVQPTFHTPAQNLPEFLQGSGYVSYESEEGRLLRPCKCKGSSRYVHEGCLQAWRHADPSYGRRNYWQCPTCGFRYQLARLGWARVVASVSAQITLTIAILILAVFFLGFVADPIINMYLDPWSYLMPFSGFSEYDAGDYEPYTWTEHFLKGFTSMGVIGFLKVILASPLSYFRIGGGSRGRTTGRDRYEQVSWLIILIGVFTFLLGVFKVVRSWSRRTLEKAGERVMDVQGDDDDDGEEQPPPSTS